VRELIEGPIVPLAQRSDGENLMHGLDRLLLDHVGPGLDVEDHVLERLTQRPVADVELLIELGIAQATAEIEKLVRGPAIVFQQPVEQIHLTSSLP